MLALIGKRGRAIRTKKDVIAT
jgi:hypothetical protein